ncbi:MAG: hypothetical protein MUC62_08880 [Candidatus Thermoplasmatota archaeon]|jgi:hypothetical protein|nr:hypothetical protein [Candidatus Thermoplasmatota archaeon]
MLPPQLIICEEVLPQVRKMLAKELYASGSSQSEISLKLGTSQAMVSKYLKDKDGPTASIRPMVTRMTRELAAAAISGEDVIGLTDRFCRSVDLCMAEGMLAERYRERFGTEPPSCCFGPTGPMTERSRLLDELSSAVLFLKARPIPGLIPAVKLNIAYALPGAGTKDQVASFPNRLPDHKGTIGEPRPPEFGASNHLSSVLLAASKGRPGISAVMNTRSGPDVMNAIRKMGEEASVLDRKEHTLEEFLSEPGTLEGDLVIDPGDFGIEPCLYIFGPSPLEVVHRAFEVHRALMMKEGGKDQ